MALEERVWRPYHYEYKQTHPIWPAFGAYPFRGRRVCRAKGIIAIGDIAQAGLFAIGGIAAGLISLGGLSAGCSWVGWQSACLPPAAWARLASLPRGLAVGGYFAMGGLAASKRAAWRFSGCGRIAAGGFSPGCHWGRRRGTVSLLTNALSAQAVRDVILWRSQPRRRVGL